MQANTSPPISPSKKPKEDQILHINFNQDQGFS